MKWLNSIQHYRGELNMNEFICPTCAACCGITKDGKDVYCYIASCIEAGKITSEEEHYSKDPYDILVRKECKFYHEIKKIKNG